MSRKGVEPKPEWRSVPAAVREQVTKTLVSPVARAMRIWGGYGLSPTYRLRLNNGKKAFLKATFPGSNEYQRFCQNSAPGQNNIVPHLLRRSI
ncbi:MAG: hypothetical protein O3B95_07730, partial [Chloroflexi bacterium]|nr:hypothetical protein [Chloroflexota bacterium]